MAVLTYRPCKGNVTERVAERSNWLLPGEKLSAKLTDVGKILRICNRFLFTTSASSGHLLLQEKALAGANFEDVTIPSGEGQ